MLHFYNRANSKIFDLVNHLCVDFVTSMLRQLAKKKSAHRPTKFRECRDVKTLTGRYCKIISIFFQKHEKFGDILDTHLSET